MAYPLNRRNDRNLPADYRGPVITCDVDKTYLDTKFESAYRMAAIPLEWAIDKKDITGMAPVLRELRHGGGEKTEQTPFYFVTASPPFLLKPLTKKMTHDGIHFDGITTKNWHEVIFKFHKPAWLKRQLGYKLCALLNQRSELPERAVEILIGDDSEVDALAYAVYGDLIAGRINTGELVDIMKAEHSDDTEIAETLKAFFALGPIGERVERIYIYLEGGSDPDQFSNFSDGVIACRSPFQLAVHLATEGRVRLRATVEAARALLKYSKSGINDLTEELHDGVRRSIFPAARIGKIHQLLYDENLAGRPGKYPAPSPKHSNPSRKSVGGALLIR